MEPFGSRSGCNIDHNIVAIFASDVKDFRRLLLLLVGAKIAYNENRSASAVSQTSYRISSTAPAFCFLP
jgi:hypothetical protein